MSKRGREYERVVADVAKAIDPGARVSQGAWVLGPDGHRDMDVFIEGSANSRPVKVLIECKDFDPKSTGPVGIGFIDALESKRRDLQPTVTLMCSNAGFTTDAISKARRVGIGLIAVMKSGDKRVRYAVGEELYVRKVKVEHLSISLADDGPIHLGGAPFESVLFDGLPVGHWVVQRAQIVLAANPIVNGAFTAAHKLKSRVQFQVAEKAVFATQLGFELRVSGGWYAQQITIDATTGIYDWIRHRVRLAPGPGKLHLQNVNLDAGSLIRCPPQRELEAMKDLRPGEVSWGFLVLTGLEVPGPIPPIEALIEPSDLELAVPNLPESAYLSVGA